MTKYTIKKVLEKAFDEPIWKIEVDCRGTSLAVECRNAQTTYPTFYVYILNRKAIIAQYKAEEKEWTIDCIQGDYLILKKYGTSSPIQAGIKIIPIQRPEESITFAEYSLKNISLGTLVAVHRSIPSGLLFYIDIATGKVSNKAPDHLAPVTSPVANPFVYKGRLPPFMAHIEYADQLWLQPSTTNFIWCYHQKTAEGYDLHLVLTSKSEILDQVVVLKNLSQLIHQPFFMVNAYIFFLSDTKQDISTYLV